VCVSEKEQKSRRRGERGREGKERTRDKTPKCSSTGYLDGVHRREDIEEVLDLECGLPVWCVGVCTLKRARGFVHVDKYACVCSTIYVRVYTCVIKRRIVPAHAYS
jgi:hypothetical protein